MNRSVLPTILDNPATQMFFGALISVLTTIFLDWQKRPKIRVEISPPTGGRPRILDPNGTVIDYYQEASLIVTNLKRWPLRWPRQTLQRATAAISFLDPNTGANFFYGSMRGRWASMPQPEIVMLEKGKKVFRGDPSLIATTPVIDIPWGSSEKLDIAARFDGESWVYGWSNENYYDKNARYRSDNWRIDRERCLVRVVITGSGEKIVKLFALVNVLGNPVRLETPTQVESSLASTSD